MGVIRLAVLRGGARPCSCLRENPPACAPGAYHRHDSWSISIRPACIRSRSLFTHACPFLSQFLHAFAAGRCSRMHAPSCRSSCMHTQLVAVPARLARFKPCEPGQGAGASGDCVTRRKLQTPGNAEEHKRQETPTINPIGPTDTPHRPSTKHYRKDSPGDA